MPRPLIPVFAALFFSTAPALVLSHGVVVDTELVQRGKQIAARHCADCHGMDGIGVLRHDPNLAGQKFDYLIHELESFAQGGRPFDRNSAQFAQAHQLIQRDIEAVSAYYASLRHRHTRSHHRIASGANGIP